MATNPDCHRFNHCVLLASFYSCFKARYHGLNVFLIVRYGIRAFSFRFYFRMSIYCLSVHTLYATLTDIETWQLNTAELFQVLHKFVIRVFIYVVPSDFNLELWNTIPDENI